MEHVTSADGTRIAFERSGTGPPLVLVNGTGAAPPTAWPAFAELERRFRTIAMQRRGRGSSGDADVYAIEREFEDVAAVVDAVGEPVNLLGHSYGGLLALEATRRTERVRRLVVYEGVPSPDHETPEEALDRLDALLEAGDREALLTTHYREVVKMSPADVERLRGSPAWADRLATAPTVPREVRAFDRYVFDPERFRDWRVPTVLLVGGDSPGWVRRSTDAVGRGLPGARVVVWPGQEHVGMYTAPDAFVEVVVAALGVA
jgi:pimeloyl-ACP methyl ester carboxylesterase